MESEIISIPEIGPVLFEKSAKAKNINISVRYGRGVRVAVPRRLSFKKAISLIEPKFEWILAQLKKMEQTENSLVNCIPGNNEIDVPRAKRYLVNRLNMLAQKHGFTFNKVSIRNQKTRWGSCSSDNNINLNIKLFKLPEELSDYVILHELVHTRVKNHSKYFWQELDKYTGKSKLIDKKLRSYKLAYL